MVEGLIIATIAWFVGGLFDKKTKGKTENRMSFIFGFLGFMIGFWLI